MKTITWLPIISWLIWFWKINLASVIQKIYKFLSWRMVLKGSTMLSQQVFGIRYTRLQCCHQFQWEGYILKDIVDLVNNQNSLSKKIQDTDINRLNNSIINRNKYYYSNNLENNKEKPVSLRDLSNTNSTITSEASHFGFKNGGELII